MLIAKTDSNSDSGFGLTILEYSRIVYYPELPIPRVRVQISYLPMCEKLSMIFENFMKIRLEIKSQIHFLVN